MWTFKLKRELLPAHKATEPFEFDQGEKVKPPPKNLKFGISRYTSLEFFFIPTVSIPSPTPQLGTY